MWLEQILAGRTTCGEFFQPAPPMNASWERVLGSVCGYKLQEIEDPLRREIRHPKEKGPDRVLNASRASLYMVLETGCALWRLVHQHGATGLQTLKSRGLSGRTP